MPVLLRGSGGVARDGPLAVCDNGRVTRTPEQKRSRRVWIARGIAVVADALQIVALPAFSAGLLSPFDEIIDLGVGAIMVVLLGWHIAFLPTFLAEIVPFVDLFPTWTAAVLFATRRSAESKRNRAAQIAGASRSAPSAGDAEVR
ncbi:MAG: hypothetical protein ACKVU1_15195 [bacterium]